MLQNRLIMNNFNIRLYATGTIYLLVGVILILPVKAQTNADGDSPQFLFQDFVTGKVILKNGLSQSAKLNFNTVSEKIVYKKENEVYDIINIRMIDAVIINDRTFVPFGNTFHELLLIAPIPLLVKHKGEILPPGKTVGYGGKSLVSSVETLTSVNLPRGYYNLKLPVDYSVKIEKIYLISVDGDLCRFVNERQFLKIFPEKVTELKEYIKQNHIRFEKSSDIIKLIIHCNELFPPDIHMS
jgi:hypothetical protein